ncbi:MAG: ABC transporter ATP-binding protein [Anaerolineales bacterium]|nr:ABC transporter ATP-binding protein [Anaerolineales bacterium]
MNTPAVRMSGITKTFPGMYRSVVANDNIDLTIEQGEIHVIIGENGAGKSTLMNILYGLLEPDHGQIEVFGKPVRIPTPQQAIGLGINMIHQHFMLIPSFTIGENIVLGNEPHKNLLLDRRTIRGIVRELSDGIGMSVDPDRLIQDTAVGVQQRVEILKSLYRKTRILILDEPTAVLTPQEIDELFNSLRSLAAQGTTIILITHKLPEVMAIAHRVTVLRDGAVIGHLDYDDLEEHRMAEMMTGRPFIWKEFARARETGDPVLEARDLFYEDERRVAVVNGVSISVHAGEIVGIAGVAHNGQEELGEILTGQRRTISGSIHLNGIEISQFSVRRVREMGLGHIPDDRYGEGCAHEASLSRNLIMGLHYKPPLGGRLFLKQLQVNNWADSLIEEYAIKTNHRDMPIRSLSGGNVQKAIVAREMKIASNCLIAEQPSRGIDIGAAEFVYDRIYELRNNGAGILLISNDLNEVLRLSDRILVIYNGRIVGERLPDQTTPENLGLLMAGIQS